MTEPVPAPNTMAAEPMPAPYEPGDETAAAEPVPADDTARAEEVDADPDTTVVPDAVRTQGAELAWSADHPVVEELDDPHHHEASWRRVAVIGAVVVAAAAVVAGGLIAWDRHSQPPPAPVPSTAAKPLPTPEKPPAWHLNGAYRIEIRKLEGTVRDGATGAVRTMRDLNVSTATVWRAFKTDCTPTNCTARTVKLDDVTHQHANGDVALLRWNGIEWESTGGAGEIHSGRLETFECDDGPGASVSEYWVTIPPPMPDGSFRGTSHIKTVKAECFGSTLGDQMDVPLVAVRIGDPPPGVFK